MTLLKDCFTENPPTRVDPHHQVTDTTAGQLIKFVRAVGQKVLLATFGMLEDVLLKIGGKDGKVGTDRSSGAVSFV